LREEEREFVDLFEKGLQRKVEEEREFVDLFEKGLQRKVDANGILPLGLSEKHFFCLKVIIHGFEV